MREEKQHINIYLSSSTQIDLCLEKRAALQYSIMKWVIQSCYKKLASHALKEQTLISIHFLAHRREKTFLSFV